jgi:hypothetical protein
MLSVKIMFCEAGDLPFVSQFDEKNLAILTEFQ